MSHKSPNFNRPIGKLKWNFGFYNRLGKSYFHKRSLASNRILFHGFAWLLNHYCFHSITLAYIYYNKCSRNTVICYRDLWCNNIDWIISFSAFCSELGNKTSDSINARTFMARWVTISFLMTYDDIFFLNHWYLRQITHKNKVSVPQSYAFSESHLLPCLPDNHSSSQNTKLQEKKAVS